MSTQIVRGAFTMILGVFMSIVIPDYTPDPWRLVLLLLSVVVILTGYGYIMYATRPVRTRVPSAVRDRIREGLNRARDRKEQ